MTVEQREPQQGDPARAEAARQQADAARQQAEAVARLDQYRRWARFLFVLLAIVAAVGFVLLLVSAPLDVDRLLASWPVVVVIALNVVATLIALLSLYRGLGDGTPWALHAVAPVCYVLIASGLVRLLLSLAGGGLLIPLEALAALLVLSRPHGPELLPIASDDDRRRVWLITAVLFLAYFIPLLIEIAGR